jgi:signal peptidase II
VKASKPPTGAAAWSRAFILVGAIVALDQVTKQLAVSNIERGDPVHLAAGFELSNLRNKGIAFGLLEGGKAPVLALTLGALVLLIAYFVLNPRRPGLWIAVGLLTGGALGNLADRVRIKAVIDFLDPPIWPAFNVADVAIVVGVALLVVVLVSPEHGPDRTA